MSPYLKINKLILVGVRKNYIIPFHPGVNIIYGDSDTGKSSILEFINYLLGYSEIELADEVIASVYYAALDITINGIDYTIKRDIFKKSELVEVYQCSFEDCDNHYPSKYSPSYSSNNNADGFFSDFLLESLNLPIVKIKKSPSKIDSDMKRLGFRGLFKYCYLNQDEVGSKSFLDLGNWVKVTTNQEVFKYIFNVLDSSIAELEGEISKKAQESTKYKNKYNVVSDFLRDTDYDSLGLIDESIEEIDVNIDELKAVLEQVNSAMTADSESYKEIKSIYNELSLKDKGVLHKISSIEALLDKYSRLKNDYDNDIDKIQGLKIAKERIGQARTESNSCPVCDNEIKSDLSAPHFQITPSVLLDDELNSLIKRRRNIKELIDSQSVRYKELIKEKQILQKDIIKAREMLDLESKEMISPYLTQRDTIVKEIASQTQKRESLVKNLRIRNQQEKLLKIYESLEKDIVSLNDKLVDLKSKAPDLNGVLSNLSDTFNEYLKFVNIKNRRDIRIGERSLAPVIRGKDYLKITSGGLRTIASIGYLLSILEYSLEDDINHPSLLMIDTVGKYLGKTVKSKYSTETDLNEDAKEGLSDPLKYQNIYEKVISVANKAEIKGKHCQIILVDNDVPEAFINDYKGFIVAHYSSTGENNLKTGLIDDYYSKV